MEHRFGHPHAGSHLHRYEVTAEEHQLIAAGRCTLGALCTHPSSMELYECCKCEGFLHLECAQAIDRQEVEDYEGGVCCPPGKGCQVSAVAHAPTGSPAAGSRKRKERDDTTSLRTKCVGTKVYPVLRIPLQYFVALDVESVAGGGEELRYVDVPHPKCPTSVVDPFTVPGHKKRSPYWMLFSFFDMSKEENKNVKRKDAQCCNICGRVVKSNDLNSPHPLSLHIKRNHKEVYQVCIEAFSTNESSTAAASTSTGRKAKKATQQTTLAKYKTVKTSQEVARQEIIRAQVAMIVSTDSSYNIVENEQFRNMLETVRTNGKNLNGNPAPQEKMFMSREAVVDEIACLSVEARNAIKTAMTGHIIHGKADNWQSRDCRQSFESNSLQWIDGIDFTMQSVSCSLEEVTGKRSAEGALNSYGAFCKDWDIELCGAMDAITLSATIAAEKVLMAVTTTDTAPAMNKFGLLLTQQTQAEHIVCTDRILEQTAEIAYSFSFELEPEIQEQVEKALEGDDDKSGHNLTLRRCRQLTSLFVCSANKMKQLEGAQKAVAEYDGRETVGVVQDERKGWWSTYLMLERLLYLKAALEYVGIQNQLRANNENSSNPSRMLKESEWEIIDSVVYLLKPFKDARTVLASGNRVTSSLVLFTVHSLTMEVENMSKSDNQLLHESVSVCSAAMAKDLRDRLGDFRSEPFNDKVVRGHRTRKVAIHPYLIKASALDPRTKKLKQLNRCNRDHVWKAIFEEMIIIRNKLAEGLNGGSEAEAPGSAEKKPEAKTETANMFAKYDDEDSSDDEDSDDANLPSVNAAVAQACELELQSYKASKGMPIYDDSETSIGFNDPLQWWKVNHAEFPTVWIVAKFYLGIPATSSVLDHSSGLPKHLLAADHAGTTTASDHFLVRHSIKSGRI